jgi:peptidoglycan/xylan/chitin deacetylase (PgdA/CDA1 family)
MSVTRGDFLKQLGKSLPGMILGSGVAAAAHKVLDKVAAVSNAMEGPAAPVIKVGEIAKPKEIEFIKSGPARHNRIALTFDDGPTPGVTDLILDELRRHKARATFFMIGERIAAAPELARRVLDEGHDIGNHTYTHAKLTLLPPAQVEAEIQKTIDLMREVLKYRTTWFRAPFGALRQDQAHVLLQRGMRIVSGNVDPQDWSQPGVGKITGTILAEAKAGSIIICHDKFQQTVESTQTVLSELSERGLNFTTLSQLLG